MNRVILGDNYVTGDNIYLRELQNFFFEVLGMMSITHYGAIGDGRRDNYGPLQVAIDDAKRRGISFLYVPYGRFIYTGELHNYLDPDTGKPTIIFIGNPHAHIVNIRTGEEIEIKQFGFYKVDVGDEYYTKEEVDALLANIDLSDYYTKTEVDGLLANYYTKTATDGLLANYYTKTAADTLLNGKQNTLIAGSNIAIVNNVISAFGGSTDIPFASCPFPTSWTGTATSATATDSYGTWTVSTDAASLADDTVIGSAFDQNLSTKANLITASADDRLYAMIELPTGISIKPTHIKIAYAGIHYDSQVDPVVFQGYNNGTWTTLYTINHSSSSTASFATDVDVSTNLYFTKFRLNNIYSYGGYGVGNSIGEIEVSAGLLKQG